MVKSRSNRIECVGLGLCALDYTFVVDRYPRLDDKIDAVSFSRQGGGPVPTALCTLSKFGAPSAFVGKCGKDNDGKLLRDELRRFGVNIRFLILDPDSRTPRAFIIVDKESGKRTVILDRTETSALSPDELDAAVIQRARFLLIDGREPETSLTAAMLARKADGEVILDAGSPRKNIGDLLPYVDHLVVSNRFSLDFTQEVDPGRAAVKLAHMGFKSVVITSGHRGNVGATSDGQLFQQEAFKVDVVDTTGAGDVFHGAYIYGLVRGWELPRILEFASAAAALKCTRLGGRRGIPELDEVQALIKTTYPKREAVESE
jgi:sulfofructose kinase